MRLKFVGGFTLTLITLFLFGGKMFSKSTFPAFSNAPQKSIVGNTVADVDPDIRATLTIGENVHVPISEFANRILQGSASNSRFVVAQPPENLPVSAQRALDMANHWTLPMLTQLPIKTTVEYLLYTNPRVNIQNKPVWRVIYWGSGIYLTPPPRLQQGRLVQRPTIQPRSRRAITYLLIDPLNPEAEYLERNSAGPNN